MSVTNSFYLRKNLNRDDLTDFINKSFTETTNINGLFLEIMREYRVTLDQFKQMINLGADPRYKNDLAFLYAITKHKQSKVPMYYVNTYQIDATQYDYELIGYIGFMLDNIFRAIYPPNSKYLLDVLDHCIDNLSINIFLSYGNFIKIILKQGIDINIIIKKFFEKNDKFDKSSVKTKRFILEMIIDNIHQIEYSEMIDSILLMVIRYDKVQIDHIEKLINLGVNPRYSDDQYIISACVHSDLPLVKYLLDYGCDININNGELLSIAFQVYSIELAKFLLDNGITINNDAIEEALYTEDTGLITTILNNNVDIDRLIEVYFKKDREDYSRVILNFFIKNGVDIFPLIKID